MEKANNHVGFGLWGGSPSRAIKNPFGGLAHIGCMKTLAQILGEKRANKRIEQLISEAEVKKRVKIKVPISAITGRFVKKDFALRNPNTTVWITRKH